MTFINVPVNSRNMHIKFRGEDDVFICYQVDASGLGSGVSVEWWFKDGRTEQNVTVGEEEEVTQRIIEHWDDDHFDGDNP